MVGGELMTTKPACVRKGALVWWCVVLGMSGCIPVERVPSSPTYWEAQGVPSSQVLTDYSVCSRWSTVKYAESEKREEIYTDNLIYWTHIPLLRTCMLHKGYKYVGPEAGHKLQPQ
jgi:hypothetical protein